MKNGTLVVIMVAAAFGSGFCHPAAAQSAIGGVKKPAPLGGPMKQMSPVVPVNKPGSAVPVNKPAPVLAVKPAPVAPVNKLAPNVASAAGSRARCAGACVAKGPR